MRLAALTCGALAACSLFVATPGRAVVSMDQFPAKTTGDLIALCSAGKDDPLETAAVNWCHVFAEGAVEIALSYQAAGRKGREAFCLPTPRPSHDEALSQFIAWANADPKRLDEPPAVGLVRFLIHQYPCPHPGAKNSDMK